MSIRIYALAQQLKVETKTLVDILKKIGIEGKGSALASLTEEEVEKVKATFQKTTTKPVRSGVPFPDTPFQRPSGSSSDKKIPVLNPTSSQRIRRPDGKTDDIHLDEESPLEAERPSDALAAENSVDKMEAVIVEETPTETFSADVTPTEMGSTDVAPAEAAFSDAVPAEAASPEAVPAEAALPEAVPAEAALPEAVPAEAALPEAVPAEAALPEAIPAEAVVPDAVSTATLVDQRSDASKQDLSQLESKASGLPKKEMPTLPPPLGRVDLSATIIDSRTGKKKGSPLHGFRKKTPDLPPEGKVPNVKVPSPSVAPPSKPSAPPVVAPPITTGLSEPGHAAAVSRADYRSPMRGVIGKIPNLDPRQKNPEGEKGSGTGSTRPVSPSKPSGPTVRLAPVPVAPTSKTPKIKEPTPQKPDMKLPAALIRDAATTGSSKPLEDHIRKHDEKQRLKETERKTKEVKKPGTGKAPPRVLSAAELAEEQLRIAKGGVRKRGGPLEPMPLVDDAKKKRRGGGGAARKGRHETEEDHVFTPRQLKRVRHRGRAESTAAPRKSDIVVQMPCTVKQFAEQTGLSVVAVIKKLVEMGTTNLMINSQLDRESSELLADAFGIPVTVKDQVSLEDRLVTSLFEQEDPPESLKPRPPVVTVLGHVDHGKTTLLDRILHLNVVSGEKGGITQHIRAYRVKMDNGEDITFVDTPGHEAFTEMRARGANCTDIVVLVVAADDGVMPQTEEAISHAKAAGVPIIVALNKTDIPGVNIDRVIQELAAHELMPSEWGGDVEVIRCSALTGQGVDTLLNTIQVVAELNELKANPDRSALGVALESELQSGQGVVCKVLVQHGTLRLGDVVLCGTAYGKVKAMYNSLNTKQQLNEAPPSTPVNLIGLDVAPAAGSRFYVLNDISDARTIAQQRLAEQHKDELSNTQSHVTLETLFQRLSDSKTVQTLNIIIRADVRGSIEAIRKELGKLEHPEVKIKILQATVGGITEADVQLADASDAIIVGFNVVPDENARSMADKKKIQVRRYEIIYNLTDDIKKALEGMLKPLEQVKELGRALVQQVFSISRLGSIAGCRIVAGTIERDSKIRIIRDSRIIGEYPLDSLKREKDDVKEVREGYECGMKLKGFNDLKEGDVLEAYKIEEIARTF